jgi:hypothetical protein
MNKQQYLRSVRVLSDPILYFEYDEVQIAMMAQKAAGYRFKKCAQTFAILATICTIGFIGTTWAVQQNTLGAGVELLLVFSSIFVCACIMIEPARELFHRGEIWDKTETDLKQVLWETRPNAKYER